ncbi:hypothetical protein Y026_4861 [Burkholderia pseudomallei TSV28]|nr:hypothetical protein Y026_4861 [Burkholderia pseudomallei TSV28]
MVAANRREPAARFSSSANQAVSDAAKDIENFWFIAENRGALENDCVT